MVFCYIIVLNKYYKYKHKYYTDGTLTDTICGLIIGIDLTIHCRFAQLCYNLCQLSRKRIRLWLWAWAYTVLRGVFILNIQTVHVSTKYSVRAVAHQWNRCRFVLRSDQQWHSLIWAKRGEKEVGMVTMVWLSLAATGARTVMLHNVWSWNDPCCKQWLQEIIMHGLNVQ